MGPAIWYFDIFGFVKTNGALPQFMLKLMGQRWWGLPNSKTTTSATRVLIRFIALGQHWEIHLWTNHREFGDKEKHRKTLHLEHISISFGTENPAGKYGKKTPRTSGDKPRRIDHPLQPYLEAGFDSTSLAGTTPFLQPFSTTTWTGVITIINHNINQNINQNVNHQINHSDNQWRNNICIYNIRHNYTRKFSISTKINRHPVPVVPHFHSAPQ
jgi:hypothetical protein